MHWPKHTRHPLLASCFIALAALTVCGAPPAQAGPHDFVAYVTRLGGDSDVAQPYIAKFTKHIEGQMGWTAGSTVGKFFSSRKDAQTFIGAQKPGFGLIEPALYAELRREQNLEPLVQVVSTDLNTARLVLVVKDPAIKALADLKGKRLFTQLAEVPRYLSKVVLDDKVDAATFFQLKPTRQAMRGVYAVVRGDAEAVLLDEGQLEAAKKIEGGGTLRALQVSSTLPPLPLVAFTKTLEPKDRAKLVKVLLTMCGTPTGGEVCKEMRISKFAPVDGAVWKELHALFDRPPAKVSQP